jgi:hypothetical protein
MIMLKGIYTGDVRDIQSHQNPDDGDGDGSRNVGFFLYQPTQLIAREDFIDMEK